MATVMFDIEKTKEEMLREELRSTRGLMASLMARGVALLAVVELILYYVRQDVTAHLRELGRLNADALMPFVPYVLGTLLLLIIAFIFAQYTLRIAQHYLVYRLQLVSMTPTFSGIAESIQPDKRPTQHYAFYAFPLFDLAVWLLFYAAESFGSAAIVW